jgi:integrase
MSLWDLLSDYLASRLDAGPCWRSQLSAAIAHLERHLGRPAETSDLTRPVILEWLRWLGGRLAPRSVNSYRTCLLALWGHAAGLGLASPPYRLPRRKVPRRLPVVWTIEEVGRLLSACDLVEGFWGDVPARACWRMGLLILWDTGCRIGTLLKAKVADVHLDAGTWFVPAASIKGSSADRLFRLHAQTVGAVRETLRGRRDLLLPFPACRRQVWRYFRRLLELAGLSADRSRMFHCLRRTSESYAAAVRGPAWAAAAVGHSLAVAEASYISPLIAPPPALIDALPRPAF